MDDFIKRKANARSLAKRKLVCGVGVNDSLFLIMNIVNGKEVVYQPYRAWKNMLGRCYDPILHERQPTYIGCEVCPEWLIFSNFELWFLTQDWQGKELDKDIISQGNKVYSPATCCFISSQLNTLLVARDAARGACPMGVSWCKQNKKYRAKIGIGGKSKHLGRFNIMEEAKAAYDSAKYAEIHRHAMMQDDPAIREGLLNWVVE